VGLVGLKGSVMVCGGGTKEAVTAEPEETLQPAVPEQAPSHPPKVEGWVAEAVRLTTVPVG
jgi:hypothetical protein